MYSTAQKFGLTLFFVYLQQRWLNDIANVPTVVKNDIAHVLL